ncbi:MULTISPECIES: TatD family hydrolase [unclassified Halomonas]|uniref:TatD family hydrolase n=1 Tax=unclassified Halomonas TaxID=2609666 RepID=UPI0007D98330|nr:MULTISPECIES: TatD family hydrolase [unclassified Halomonas]MBT2787956.1 TatD family hydrolase [Halomonas sp. ISL-106]MBT2795705.1 TatD family hydrolase [Halomonas sp. ISL-104]OAL61003.1 hydrolase TatD [Halomonas sp. ALS9]
MLVDAHCHLDFTQFDDDRTYVFEAAKVVGVVRFVVPGTTRSRWQQVLALGARADTSVCLGMHPYFVDQHQEADIAALDNLLSEHPEVVAVGECGIDGRFSDTLDAQWHYFDAQLKLAKQHSMPVVVHCVHANDKVAKRLRQLALPKAGLIHAFSGSIEQATKFLDLGFKLGLGGAITYERAKRLRRTVAALPDDAFVLETDSPDMPLSGYQGKRNEPCRVAEVCNVVATLRGQTVEQVAALSSQTAATLFGLSLT